MTQRPALWACEGPARVRVGWVAWGRRPPEDRSLVPANSRSLHLTATVLKATSADGCGAQMGLWTKR